ncbi:MAG: hypothetical protein IPL46_25250 [Saprospiraceae bacterium]|nr:hypothetical protein [Saprospiraceae bacterium]
MASHFKVLNPGKFEPCLNVFLIRDPLRIITSYSKVIKEPTEQDVGIKRQAELYRWFAEKAVHKPIVIDSNDVLGIRNCTFEGFAKLWTYLLNMRC